MRTPVVGRSYENTRGFTLVELLIVLSIFGVIGAIVMYLIAGRGGAASTTKAFFDHTTEARAWAEGLQYEVVAVNCANMPEDSFVRCSVRVREQAEPFALMCNTISKSCGLAQRH